MNRTFKRKSIGASDDHRISYNSEICPFMRGQLKLEGQWPWIPRELQQCVYAGWSVFTKLTLELTNYFANKQDHAMKEKQSNILHHHSLLSEDISWTDETSHFFKVLQNRQFSTDRDYTMTRHDFRPWFICVLN